MNITNKMRKAMNTCNNTDESQNTILTNYSIRMKPNNKPKECIFGGCLGWEDLTSKGVHGNFQRLKNVSYLNLNDDNPGEYIYQKLLN